jgi:hypothetical protein
VDRAAGARIGWDAADIATVVTADAVETRAKRRAMAAHASQMPADAVHRSGFAAAYGREWFRRVGDPGLIDSLT